MSAPGSLTLRLAREGDDRELRALAGRDSAPSLRGTILLAERAGEIRAAVSLEERRLVADPFHSTADLVELLWLRASQLQGAGDRRQSRRLPRPLPGRRASPRPALS